MEFLYHYFDESSGPFRNLSDLDHEEAEAILANIRLQKKGFAGQRQVDYMDIRHRLEARARELFILKGGKPLRSSPHYMTVGKCPWLIEWYENGKELEIPLRLFHPLTVSFTYGDLFPTMRVQDGKAYRGQVYTLNEIEEVIAEFGLPQVWNKSGQGGPERYIEVQVWDDKPLLPWLRSS